MKTFPIPETRAVFVDDFDGKTFPLKETKSQFSLVLDLLDKTPAIIAQSQTEDELGMKFERILWRPRTGDTFYRLSEQLTLWIQSEDFQAVESTFIFQDGPDKTRY